MPLKIAKIRTDKNIILPLPNTLKGMMNQLAQDLGVKNFILYGGAAMDLLTDSSQEIRDLDIAITLDQGDIEQLKSNLRKAGYQILGKDREYYLNIIDPVTIVFAQNNQWVLDVAILGGPLERKIALVPPSAFHTSMDKFDIDSVFWRYPQLDVVDLYDAFTALKNKTMSPLYSLYEENPYLLVNRMINMCAKYQMSICDNFIHKKSFEVLVERISQWEHNGEFHGESVKTAHYSTVLKAIKRARNREQFIADLLRSRILACTMPELQEGLSTISGEDKAVIETAKTKKEIALVLLRIVPIDMKDILEARLESLGLRTWDSEDQAINNSR